MSGSGTPSAPRGATAEPAHHATVALGDLGVDAGGHVLVALALRDLAPAQRLLVTGTDPDLVVHLGAWARTAGHRCEGTVVEKGAGTTARWQGAERAGDALHAQAVERAPASWGLAARGALVEAGGPPWELADLAGRDEVWSEAAGRLYAQAVAGQWDPEKAVDWAEAIEHSDDVEDAVVQVMTYLVENEQAALVLPARFVPRIHPHYREVVQLLAVQAADEARHVEVFTRRALLRRRHLGTSTVAGRRSLATLFEEQDFAVASFLLSVMGEGTFLQLLSFLETYGPDPVTRRIAHLARLDEARHVAFAMAHLAEHLPGDHALRGRLAAAVRMRHDALAGTAGLNADVFDALVVLAAGSLEPAAISRGFSAVGTLVADMDEGRRRRLAHLGFDPAEAAELSSLHTRNFM